MDREARGVYAWYSDDENPADAEIGTDWRRKQFAIALAKGGPKARLWGPSALEVAKVGTIGGGNVCIEVPSRRRDIAGITWIVDVDVRMMGEQEMRAMALPSQTMFKALLASKGRLDDDKFDEALADALEKRLITERQYERILEQRS